MEQFSIPSKNTLNPIHPIELLNLQFWDINELPNTLHKKLYDTIATSNPPATLSLLQKIFLYIPILLLETTLEYKTLVHGYHKPPGPPIHPPPINQHINYFNIEAKITTWNITSLNTSIPYIYTYSFNKITMTYYYYKKQNLPPKNHQNIYISLIIPIK